ncbi:MAG TPA: glycosyltransferase family 2 protein [Acidisoma sp.]|jgi:dolichol-phosphate mannosyltransferase|uniref:glycosyltransferase family 2 protein n=1 Tax=Acidisoma sp. TaxID=1872115 RepID=UPI002CEFCF8E|nr:glycosyltransferase family 2 protein [Acidisoma sp.]HTH99407.1 glycosyltransferase family 2 protein [Acidisoma sp.]
MDELTVDHALPAATFPVSHSGMTSDSDPATRPNVARQSAARQSAELSIVVPCYKERPNVRPMVERVAAALPGVDWEIIFVDDNSPDGTAEEARSLARVDPRVRCIRRIGRRGLSSAVIEGALSSSADFVAVMDGDLQHDQTVLPDMLAQLRRGGADVVIGSRHVLGGSSDGLSSATRHRISNAGIAVAQYFLPMRVTDPMSGFFMMPRARFEAIAPRLSGQGFKILLDLILSAPERLRVLEIPCQFHRREAGESKLDALVMVQFASLLLDKSLRGYVPMRFLAFALVGALGVVVNIAALWVGQGLGLDFVAAEVIATVIAMLFNFQLNNRLTYRSHRLRGPKLLRGLVLFMLVCGLGAVANVGIATALFSPFSDNGLAAAAVGAAVGVVWNYAVSSTLVWRTV